MSYKHIFSVGFIYFLILLLIVVFVKDIAVQYNNLIFLTPGELAVSKGGYADPKTFIRTALDITEDGWITSKNAWVFNLWPPGFVLLEALIIKIFGTNVPILLVLQTIASIMFAVVLTFFYIFAKKYMRKEIAFLLPLVVFIFPVSRAFLLEPLGISFGESFAIGSFMLFVVLSIHSTVNHSMKYAFLAGAFLGLTAYFRSNFGAILLMLIVFGILFIIIFYIFKIFKNRIIFKKNIVTQITAILIAAIMISIPWKAYKYMQNGSIKSTTLQYKTLVRTNDDLKSHGADWVVAGRGNMMCLVDRDTCGIKDNSTGLLIKTFLTNPIKWYSIKAEVIGDYWFANTNEMVVPKSKATLGSIFFNSSVLLMLIVLIYMTIKLRKETIVIFLTWINFSLFIIYSMIFTVAHYEARYFYFPKIIIIFMFLLFVVLYYKNINEKEKAV
jgi:hypothetical protein